MIIIITIKAYPKGVENNGKKYDELSIDIMVIKNTGTSIKTYIINLELLVKDFSSNFNFLRLNNVFSIESKTLIIFPPVLLVIDRDAVK